jgi:plastocyanin
VDWQSPVLGGSYQYAMRKILIVVAVASLVVALPACGKSSKTSSSGSSSGPPVSLSGKLNDHGTKAASATMELEADDYYFSPTFIKGTAGETIKVELKNESKVKHNFTVDGTSTDVDLDPGSTMTVSVTLPTSGALKFHCEYHQALGMQGAFFIG